VAPRRVQRGNEVRARNGDYVPRFHALRDRGIRRARRETRGELPRGMVDRVALHWCNTTVYSRARPVACVGADPRRYRCISARRGLGGGTLAWSLVRRGYLGKRSRVDQGNRGRRL